MNNWLNNLYFAFDPEEGVSSSLRLCNLQWASTVVEDRERTLRYLIFLYDKKSILPEQFQETGMRRAEAAKLAGYDFSVEEDRDRVEALKTLDPKKVGFPIQELINEMLIAQNDRLWTMIVANEDTFYEYQLILSKQIEGESDKQIVDASEKKGKLMQYMDEVNERLEVYYDRFYRGDKELMEVLVNNDFSPESQAGK